MLKERAEEIVKEAEEITEILCEDSQALWVVLHRSLAHKFDYHLSLSYPSDIRPVAAYLDSGLHKLWYPVVRDMSTWSKFGAHGEHGDVFLFSNLGTL